MNHLNETGAGGTLTYEQHMERLNSAVANALRNERKAHIDNALKAKHLDRAYDIWNKAHYNNGLDRTLNITRMHDLLGMENGADEWSDEVFLGEEIPE